MMTGLQNLQAGHFFYVRKIAIKGICCIALVPDFERTQAWQYIFDISIGEMVLCKKNID